MHKEKMTVKKASALRYSSEMPSPLIVFNGRAEIAQKMIDIATEEKIPIVYEPETQEILSLYEAGDYVPEETWNILAKVFAFIRGQLETTSKN